MNYPATVILVTVVSLYAARFLWRHRRPAFAPVNNVIDVGPLFEGLTLAMVLLCASSVAQPPQPAPVHTAGEAVARDTLRFLGYWLLPLLWLAVLFIGVLPVLISLMRDAFCACPDHGQTSQNNVGSSE